MRYDVTNHALLSEAAKRLGPTELNAYAIAAESLLRLTDFSPFAVGTDDYLEAQVAVALQVSFQVEAGIEAFVVSSTHRGGRTVSFRRGQRNMTVTHAIARKIASRLRAKALA